MHQAPSRSRNTRAIDAVPAEPTPPRPPPRRVSWTYVEPPLTPMPTVEEVVASQAAEGAAAQARARRKPHRPRSPQHCTMGYGYYASSDQCVPTLRLRGHWLERLGFAIGSKLHIVARQGELVVTVAGDGGVTEVIDKTSATPCRG